MDAFGQLLGWTDGNNVSTVMAYDQATGAPVGISSGIGQSSAVQQLTYTWDGFGNLTKREDANISGLDETFGYGRVYDPTVARFISADPTIPAPFYSQAFNRYS